LGKTHFGNKTHSGNLIMRKSIAAFGVGILLASVNHHSAAAADMTLTKAPPPMLAPAATWTGFYVGGNVGYGWVDPTVSFNANPEPVGGGLAGLVQSGQPATFDMMSAIGGVQIGYNYQLNRQWLAGVETDFDFGDVKGSGSANNLSSIHVPFSSTADERIGWFSTFRGRLGYLPVNNLLLYATGGFALAGVKEKVAYNNNGGGTVADQDGNCAVGAGACYTGSSSRNVQGWTAGGGLEYAFADRWSVRTEYLYIDLGDNNFTESVPISNTPGVPASTINVHYTPTILQVVRASLNYRF
jgi:outer membrane immunogenic protein